MLDDSTLALQSEQGTYSTTGDHLNSRRAAFYIDVREDEQSAQTQEPAPPGPIDLLSSADVRTAVATLTPRDRTIFERAYFDDTPHQQIARELLIPQSTIGTRLFRIKKRVRRILEEMYRRRLARSPP